MKHHKAYLDTFSGMVPCVVLDICDGGKAHVGCHSRNFGPYVLVRVTKQIGAYRRGDLVEDKPRYIVPRRNLRVSKLGIMRIVGVWDWFKLLQHDAHVRARG